MQTVHLILQGKGGVGKSLVSSLLCQYLLYKGEDVLAIDTDPVNHTLAGYADINAVELEIRSGDNIDPRKFDTLIEMIGTGSGERHIVIDNGASTFMPLCAWMIENQTIDMWKENGLNVLIHCVVTGGQAMRDTYEGFAALTSFQSPLIVWLNHFFGEIVNNNKTFVESGIYLKNQDKVMACVNIPLKTPATFGKDLEELFRKKQTFSSAANDTTLPVMTRQRLKIWWREMIAELDQAEFATRASEEG